MHEPRDSYVLLFIPFSELEPRKLHKLSPIRYLRVPETFALGKSIVNTFLVKVSMLYTKEHYPWPQSSLFSGEAREPKALPGSDFAVVPNWPSKETADSLGQISGETCNDST